MFSCLTWMRDPQLWRNPLEAPVDDEPELPVEPLRGKGVHRKERIVIKAAAGLVDEARLRVAVRFAPSRRLPLSVPLNTDALLGACGGG